MQNPKKMLFSNSLVSFYAAVGILATVTLSMILISMYTGDVNVQSSIQYRQRRLRRTRTSPRADWMAEEPNDSTSWRLGRDTQTRPSLSCEKQMSNKFVANASVGHGPLTKEYRVAMTKFKMATAVAFDRRSVNRTVSDVTCRLTSEPSTSTRVLSLWAQHPSVETICQTGFDKTTVGSSAINFLTSNRHATMHVFSSEGEIDDSMESLLVGMFSGRFVVHRPSGRSPRQSTKMFTADHPNFRCNIIHVGNNVDSYDIIFDMAKTNKRGNRKKPTLIAVEGIDLPFPAELVKVWNELRRRHGMQDLVQCRMSCVSDRNVVDKGLLVGKLPVVRPVVKTTARPAVKRKRLSLIMGRLH